MGYVKVSTIIQKDSMTDELRNSLWNVLYSRLWSNDTFMNGDHYETGEFENFIKYLQAHYFKKLIDELPYHTNDKLSYLKAHFFECKWNEVYDFLEFCNSLTRGKITDNINSILKRELSAYRLIDGIFAPITDKQEIEAVEELLSDDHNLFRGVTVHINTALKMLSDKKNPDYRNSIKESISAVESICKVITGKKKATLSGALQTLEKEKKFHKSLKEGFVKLYGYTNDADGIRHALMAESTVDVDDAKYFLLSCTSFINYLKTKI